MEIRDRIVDFRRVKAGALRPNPKNWRTHPKSQADALRSLLGEIGYVDALLARALPDGSLELIDGHLRAETTPDMEVPVLVVDLDDAETAKVLATFDPLSAMAGSDPNKINALLAEVRIDSEELLAMLQEYRQGPNQLGGGVTLAERFGVPPFSVLDARQGYWQDRKRAWLALGIQSEIGRGGGVWIESESGSPLDRKAGMRERERGSPASRTRTS